MTGTKELTAAERAAEEYITKVFGLYPAANGSVIGAKGEAQLAFLAGVRWAREQPDHYREAYSRAVGAARPYLQAGGRYAHLLTPGDDIILDGIPALCRELDRLRGVPATEAP